MGGYYKMVGYIAKGFRYAQKEADQRMNSDEYYLLTNNYDFDTPESISGVDVLSGALRDIGSDIKLICSTRYMSTNQERIIKYFSEYIDLYPYRKESQDD